MVTGLRGTDSSALRKYPVVLVVTEQCLAWDPTWVVTESLRSIETSSLKVKGPTSRCSGQSVELDMSGATGLSFSEVLAEYFQNICVYVYIYIYIYMYMFNVEYRLSRAKQNLCNMRLYARHETHETMEMEQS